MPFSNKEKQREYQREYQRKRRRSKIRDFEEKETGISYEVKVLIVVTLLSVVAIISILSFFGLSGPLGRYSSSMLLTLFGWGAYFFPVLLISIALVLFRGVKYKPNMWQIFGAILLFLALLGVMHHAPNFIDSLEAAKDAKGGGLVGFSILYLFIEVTGYWGAWVFLLGIAIVGILLSLSGLVFGSKDEEYEENESDQAQEEAAAQNLFVEEEKKTIFGRIKEKISVWRYKMKYSGDKPIIDLSAQENSDITEKDESADYGALQPEEDKSIDKTIDFEPEIVIKPKRKPIKIPIDLLDSSDEKPVAKDMDIVKEKIEKTFATFGIGVEMGEVNVGPTVTQYTLRPPAGVKLSRITGLANELSLELAAHPLRMEAPIPGKSLVGIEIPNQSKAIVKLKDIMSSSVFKNRISNLSLCLGKDVSGNPWIADLAKMPHLLIAGATGSGKSVTINSIIVSLLYQNSPEDLNLILVDPKKVELSVYNEIPYLVTPVITENKKTVNALKWVVGEMERRYQLFLNKSKKNIELYNAANPNEKVPNIVFIIDELADLMSVAASDVEGAIVRLSQMSRAVGIHLVLATQRPSVNVITGLIKANIPSRIAFKVPSQIDSRTILDCSGAEKLLGYGDMLFTASDANKPRRLQGAFLDEDEIDRVVNFLKDSGEAQYNDEILSEQRGITVLGGPTGDSGGHDDELYNQAKTEILNSGKASASYLQRRLSVGYSRAARLLDTLEDEGIIGPSQGSKPREILVPMNNIENSISESAYEEANIIDREEGEEL